MPEDVFGGSDIEVCGGYSCDDGDEDSGADDCVSYYVDEQMIESPGGKVRMKITVAGASSESPNGTSFIQLQPTFNSNFISCFIDSMDTDVIVSRIEDLIMQGRFESLSVLFSDIGTARDPIAVRLKLEALLREQSGGVHSDDVF